MTMKKKYDMCEMKCSRARMTSLSNVAVSVLLPFHAFQVLLLNKNVDAFFDDLNFRLETCRELVEDFRDELRVMKSFSHFHDTDNGSLDEHFAVFFDVLVCHFLFGLLLRFQWEVDVDAKFFAVKD